jgi:hypothetical protein
MPKQIQKSLEESILVGFRQMQLCGNDTHCFIVRYFRKNVHVCPRMWEHTTIIPAQNKVLLE